MHSRMRSKLSGREAIQPAMRAHAPRHSNAGEARTAAVDARVAERSAVFMDTLISVQVVGPPAPREFAERAEGVFGWFREVERACSRFDADSEISILARRPGIPVPVSALAFEAIRFALT